MIDDQCPFKGRGSLASLQNARSSIFSPAAIAECGLFFGKTSSKVRNRLDLPATEIKMAAKKLQAMVIS
jgi:hypothetical protein